MRLWSIHPSQLDKAGLGAVWREGLLAQSVLRKIAQGERVVGYRNHPQLDRFKLHTFPLAAIGAYLFYVARAATLRGYRYDCTRIELLDGPTYVETIPLTKGQLDYELEHLRKKVAVRCPSWDVYPICHPLFRLVDGPVESWEKVS